MAIKCEHYCWGNERCQKCKCSDVGYNDFLTGVIRFGEKQIFVGRFFLGKHWPLADDHVARIRKSARQRIDIFKSGVPICNIEELTA